MFDKLYVNNQAHICTPIPAKLSLNSERDSQVNASKRMTCPSPSTDTALSPSLSFSTANFQSVLSKQVEFEYIAVSCQSNFIFETETWLCLDINHVKLDLSKRMRRSYRGYKEYHLLSHRKRFALRNVVGTLTTWFPNPTPCSFLSLSDSKGDELN